MMARNAECRRLYKAATFIGGEMKYRVLFQDDMEKGLAGPPSSPPVSHIPFTREWCFPDPLPEHLAYPAIETVCSVCETFKEQVAVCEEKKCAFAYQRRGNMQRRKDDEKNRQEKEAPNGR